MIAVDTVASLAASQFCRDHQVIRHLQPEDELRSKPRSHRVLDAGHERRSMKCSTMLQRCVGCCQTTWPSWFVLLLLLSSCITPMQLVSAGYVPRPRSSYTAICVVAKNENRYIREWVLYHTCLGVGKIYLYDHNSTVPMSSEIGDLIEQGVVEVISIEGLHTRYKPADGFADNLSKFMVTIQGQAYQDCLHRFSSRHTFMGFIDVDEFLVLHDEQLRSINELLERYEQYGGVSFYWMLFGSGGHRTMPPGWVIRSYLKCLPQHHKYNTQFKSFLNTAFRPTMYSPHRALFEVQGPNSHLVDERGRPIPAGRNKNSTHEVAAIYHYVTKSKEDFDVKIQRGGGAGVTRPRQYITKLDQQCNETCFGAALTYAKLCGAIPRAGARLRQHQRQHQRHLGSTRA
mmetsp:Transcript_25777/g.56161  ORF Transcript_25777/g.56161 Transcript_25777/m.56161 type:complete len:401 (+) Transcript_25777:202-1404(+)